MDQPADTKSKQIFLNRSTDYQLGTFPDLEQIHIKRNKQHIHLETSFPSFESMHSDEERKNYVPKEYKRSKSVEIPSNDNLVKDNEIHQALKTI